MTTHTNETAAGLVSILAPGDLSREEQEAETRPIREDGRARPGVPMELNPPRAVEGAHWSEPERQAGGAEVLKRAGLEQLTPVYGTAVPPRGVSGAMRRAAYKIPEHKTTHWLVLLLADRVDALEHGDGNKLLWALPALALGAFAIGRVRRRRSRWWA